MKYLRQVIFYLLLINFSLLATNNKDEKLIYYGIDTLNSINWTAFFDFVLQRPCSSETDYNNTEFQEHLQFGWDIPSTYALVISPVNGRFKDFGKMNLDSIKASPPDSELVEDNGGGPYRLFNVTPDSLKPLIGASYVIKTRSDPRPAWSGPFYAKLRILDFDIIDSANHEVEMVFLWACQMDHSKDLQTSNLDTFDIPVSIVSDFNKFKFTLVNNKTQSVFKIIGNKFTIPENLIGKVKFVEIYDLQGRLIKKIKIRKNDQAFDICSVGSLNKIFIVKYKMK